jgi:peptide/nickel transport system permease protein
MTAPLGELALEVASVNPQDEEDTTTEAIAGRSPTQLAIRRLKQDKIAMVAFAILAIAILVAIAAPILKFAGVFDPYSPHYTLITGEGSVPPGHFGGISWSHPLGVDPGLGRDLLSRVSLGVSFSLLIATSATIISAVLGMVIGIIAGYAGGRTDFWMSRSMDLVLSFPQTLMLLALSPVLKDRIAAAGVPGGSGGTPVSAVYLIIVLGFFGWPYLARIVRGQVLTLRNREFVEASRSLGAVRRRIWFRELLPNLWAPLIIYVSLTLPLNISAEAALAYLGVGIQQPTPDLGNILNDSVSYFSADSEYFFVPGAILVIIVLAFNMFGDGVRDALDPKSSR